MVERAAARDITRVLLETPMAQKYSSTAEGANVAPRALAGLELLAKPFPFLLDVKCPSPSFAEWSSVPEPPRGVRDRTRPLPLAGREGRQTDCDEWSPEGSPYPT